MGVVKNECGHSGRKTLKLAVLHEGINGINWYFACWYRFRKAKSHLLNGQGLLGHWTLKSALSQEWIDELSWFLHADTNSGKLKINKFCVVMVKIGHGLLGYWTLQTAVSQEWLNELSWFFACWYKFRETKNRFNCTWAWPCRSQSCGICCVSRMI